eukprot:TRINITY_DN3228_c0_g1_i3.p3 TRINITY_DN3228_c0_g1~~TRINITY_DN3228_c0_g1_i3.p3  ORF type:complete len:198 (+),score=-5.19 TRINITY_DN3228_c0_g1_i3:1314-1907(+)
MQQKKIIYHVTQIISEKQFTAYMCQLVCSLFVCVSIGRAQFMQIYKNQWQFFSLFLNYQFLKLQFTQLYRVFLGLYYRYIKKVIWTKFGLVIFLGNTVFFPIDTSILQDFVESTLLILIFFVDSSILQDFIVNTLLSKLNKQRPVYDFVKYYYNDNYHQLIPYYLNVFFYNVCINMVDILNHYFRVTQKKNFKRRFI